MDAAAAAERERSAKAAKLAAQTANAMVAVQGQLKLRGQAADKAAHDANAEAGAPVKASSMMVERVFVARLDGPDRYMVARPIPNNSNRVAHGGGLQAVFVFTRLHLDARMSWVDAPHRPNDARHAHGAGTLMHRSSRYLKSCEVGFCRAPSRPDESRSVSISRRSVCGLSLATPYRHWTTGRFASR